MPGTIFRLDYARERTLGAGAVLKLLEKVDTGYHVSQSLTQGFHVGRVFDRVKRELVDVLLIDETAQVQFDLLERSVAVDLVIGAVTRRYSYDTGKPQPLRVDALHSIGLRANFGDKTPYDA